MEKKNILKNTSWLLAFNIAKMVFPFITLPYLARVLSTDSYGTVAYVKTVMSYMQILVDFGFGLSATKDIVKAKNDKEKLQNVVGDTIVAKILLAIPAFLALIVLTFFLPILSNNIPFTLLSFGVVIASIFLMDFLFRGLEIMHIIAIRFIIMKSLSTLLTYIFVKDETDLLMIPIFDIIGSFVAIILVFVELRKLNIKITISCWTNIWNSFKDSFIYFLSNVAAVSFNALSTIVIGVCLSTTQVAYWSVCMQIVTAIQAFYTPIAEGVYPEMIRSKNINIVKKISRVFIPILLIGAMISFFVGKFVLIILGGHSYLNAETAFRCLIPAIVIGFFSVMYGWPTLGAIGKNKETTISTVTSIIFQLVGMIILIVVDKFTLINIAVLRSITELLLFVVRYYFFNKYKNEFVKSLE